MPRTASAQKSLRVSLRRRQENLRVLRALKEATKRAGSATLPRVFSIIDKAAKTHVIHPNKAARLKSALAKRWAKAATSQKSAPAVRTRRRRK